MINFNRLAARKEIGAIRHRLEEEGLTVTLRHGIIRRHLLNLVETLPVQYQSIVYRAMAANYNDPQDLVACMDRLDNLIPATYGSIPAGTVFQVIDSYYIKRKEGVEYRGEISEHFEPQTGVTIVNERSI